MTNYVVFINRVEAEVRPGPGCGVSAGDCIHRCGACFCDVPAPRCFTPSIGAKSSALGSTVPSNAKLPFLATEQPLRISPQGRIFLPDIGVRAAMKQKMATEASNGYLTSI